MSSPQPTQINNRDFIFAIKTAPTVWTEIGWLREWGGNPGANEETEDTTTVEDEGHFNQEVMQRGHTLTLTGRRYNAGVPGTRDPGQLAVEALGTGIAADSQGDIRWRHKDDEDWTEWTCTATVAEFGGGMNLKSPWGVTFTRCGKPRTVPVA